MARKEGEEKTMLDKANELGIDVPVVTGEQDMQGEPKSKTEKKLETEPTKNQSFGDEKVFCTGILHNEDGVVRYMQLGKSGNIFSVSQVKEFMRLGLNLWINDDGSPTQLELAGDNIRSRKNDTLVDNLDKAPTIKF